MQKKNPFLVLWTLAVLAATTAFCTHLALRVRSMELGYELGRSQGQLARLREAERVLQLELASYKTPERVELVARTLLQMDTPKADRVFSAGPMPEANEGELQGQAVSVAAETKAP
ncbi:MAG TPA: cell division protein FtsL [Polyangiaceae bacterium]|nr:cell division protein FtsL [Polyangiaceae bacterium]